MADRFAANPTQVIPLALGDLEFTQGASYWLLDVLRSGDARDPVDVLNDLDTARGLFSLKCDLALPSAR